MAALFAASAFANSTLNIADAQSTDSSNPAMQQDSNGSGDNGTNATTQDNGSQNGTDNSTSTTPSTGNADGNDSGASDDSSSSQ